MLESDSDTMTARMDAPGIRKCPTGVVGLDEITSGGFPYNRPTLLSGTAGCGKTGLAMAFIVHGATHCGEPGVFVSFEEPEHKLIENVAGWGWNLEGLIRDQRVTLDYVHIERGDVYEAGEYDLEGLFIRLQVQVEAIGAKRVVLDSPSLLFADLDNPNLVRMELRRMFRWFEEKGLTLLITAERGVSNTQEEWLEEFICDCVVQLDHRIIDEISTRRLRIVKYRGAMHETNEFPYLISKRGITVLPITQLTLEHEVSNERVSTGIKCLDAVFQDKGYYRGSSVLISGTSGAGKSTLAAQFANAACARGDRCLYVAFEESPKQIIRNMRSVGIDLEPHGQKGTLRFHAARPTLYGLDMHLVQLYDELIEFEPAAVVGDPISNLKLAGNLNQARLFLMRLVDHLKGHMVTAVFVNLTDAGGTLEATDVGVSSLMDTWIVLRLTEAEKRRRRILHVIKSRGMSHKMDAFEFNLTSDGMQFLEQGSETFS